MKKLQNLLYVILFTANIAAAQSSDYNKSQENINTLGSLNANDVGARGFDDRYEGVKGSPLLFEDYLNGQIILERNMKVENILVNPNNYENICLYKDKKSGAIYNIDNSKISKIFVDDLKIIFVKISSNNFDSYVKENSIFQLLHSDSMADIVKLSKISLKKAQYKGAYSVDVRYDEFIKKDFFYFKYNTDKFQKITIKKQSFIKIFPNKKSEIKTAFKNRKEKSDNKFIIYLFSILIE